MTSECREMLGQNDSTLAANQRNADEGVDCRYLYLVQHRVSVCVCVHLRQTLLRHGIEPLDDVVCVSEVETCSLQKQMTM